MHAAASKNPILLHSQCAGGLDVLVDLASATGAAGLVLTVAESGADIALSESQNACIERSKRLHAAGLATAALHLADTTIDLTHADAALRRRSEQAVVAALDRAAWSNCEALLLPTLPDGRMPHPSTDYESAYAHLLESLLRLRFEAQARAVRLALLSTERFLLSPLEMRRLVDEVNSPWFCAALRPCAIARTTRPADWVVALGHRAAHLLIETDAAPAAEDVAAARSAIGALAGRLHPAPVTFRLPAATAAGLRQLMISTNSPP